ncbi:hypothetical protein BYT27DRAFT_7244843 [Phlegmacium glaucopus]|nr:hypothetical protein BYT27DRAFT_7244843 [Phlegmacium glaucopus]
MAESEGRKFESKKSNLDILVTVRVSVARSLPGLSSSVIQSRLRQEKWRRGEEEKRRRGEEEEEKRRRGEEEKRRRGEEEKKRRREEEKRRESESESIQLNPS